MRTKTRFPFFILLTILTLCLSEQNIGQNLIIQSIDIKGNKVTKEHIILRELEFAIGDTIAKGEVDSIFRQSEDNLMNISLFHFAKISYTYGGESTEYIPIAVEISCQERWYIWPVPVVFLEDRNFNDWLEHRSLEKISYGALLTFENFRGRREMLTAGFKTGFNNEMMFKYQNPNIDKNQTIGLGISFHILKDHNAYYNTEDNRQQMIHVEDSFAIETTYLNILLSKRIGIHQYYRMYWQYNQYALSDTLLQLQPQFFESEQEIQRFFSVSFFLKFDHRDYIHYPLEGYYVDCELTKRGFGLLPDETISVLTIKPTFRKYWKLNNTMFFATGLTGRYRIDSNQSYFFNKGLGFGNDYVRGYEKYVIDGQNFILLKTNFKYNIIKQRTLKINAIKTEKFNTIPYRFYVNLFADFGYVEDKYFGALNDLSNTMLFGYGIGIDFVTYYDKAYRFEISRNLLNEFSFAIQFTAPI